MKCRRCKDRGTSKQAVISLPYHNLALCDTCFVQWYENRLKDTIEKFGMFSNGEKILVAVSGGKDSLALWWALNKLGYPADGLYVDLGIAHQDYSAVSLQHCQALAKHLSRRLIVTNLSSEIGTDIVTASHHVRRTSCSICGRCKRYYTNQTALREGYQCVATGHNLDDEAASLLANMFSWNTDLLARKGPVLIAKPGFVSRVKPLIGSTEKENVVYCLLNNIEYIHQECPLSGGTSGTFYKKILNQIDFRSPGTKLRFYYGFQESARPLFVESQGPTLTPCSECGQPTSIPPRCAMCRLKDQLQHALSARKIHLDSVERAADTSPHSPATNENNAT